MRQKGFPLSFPAILGRDVSGVTGGGHKCEALQARRPGSCIILRNVCRIGRSGRFGGDSSTGWRGPSERGGNPADCSHGRPTGASCDKREKGTGCSNNRCARQCWARRSAYHKEDRCAGNCRFRGKELGEARSLGVSDVLAIDDDKAIEKFRLVDAIADTVGGEVAADAALSFTCKDRPWENFERIAMRFLDRRDFNLAVKNVTLTVRAFEHPVRHRSKLSQLDTDAQYTGSCNVN
jgi:hypothetical protein